MELKSQKFYDSLKSTENIVNNKDEYIDNIPLNETTSKNAQ